MIYATAHRRLHMPIIISVIRVQIRMTSVVKFKPRISMFSFARSFQRSFPFTLSLLLHQHGRAPVPLRIHPFMPAVEILKRGDWVQPVRVAAPVLTCWKMIHRHGIQFPRRGLGHVCGLGLLVAVHAVVVIVHSSSVQTPRGHFVSLRSVATRKSIAECSIYGGFRGRVRRELLQRWRG